MLEPPPGWEYGDARPIGSCRPEELTTDYRQALIDTWARFLTRCLPDIPDIADRDLPIVVVRPRTRPALQPVNPLPIQMAPQDPPPGWHHAINIHDYDLMEN